MVKMNDIESDLNVSNNNNQILLEETEEHDAFSKLLENGKANFSEPNGVDEKEPKQGKKSKRTAEERLMTFEINKYLEDTPLSEDTTCGFWIFKAPFLQGFANQTSYVVLYGIVGCVFSMTYAYFNGTITTIEKRFKIPSKNTGIISVGNDISQMFVSAVLSYYAGKGHRPRWIGFGLLTIVIFCLMTSTPHFLYGPGRDALAMTSEFGAMPDENATMEVIERQRSKTLCRENGEGAECQSGEGNLAPQVILFCAQLISGIGGSLYYTLGVSYMDDNTKNQKLLLCSVSLSYFLRMLGPALGYALASFCLRIFIAPHLKPVINDKDPRWLGAWWMGWLILGGLIFFSGIFLTMFPRELPRAKARRIVEEKLRRRAAAIEGEHIEKQLKDEEEEEEGAVVEPKASWRDMLRTFRRLLANKTFTCNNLSSVFYLFGYTPYWIFSAKYIEIQYRQSAATSSLVTGTVALGFSAVGVLLSGFIISRFKPRARYMAAWNVVVGFLTVAGILAYAFIGCPGNEQSVVVNIPEGNAVTCNSACHCDYVRYSPVCGENHMTYISPCHAGCKKQLIDEKGRKTYYDCSCIPKSNSSTTLTTMNPHTQLETRSTDFNVLVESIGESSRGQAISGACPVDCFPQFVTFLAVMCGLKFFGATGRASNFLVSVRCVPEKDKTASMGFSMMLMSMCAFIPSPIFFGWVLDRLCLVWGKTCTNKGNCWLYDPASLRYTLNFTAAIFITIGALFDCGVWYYVKDLKIFDEEIKEVEMKIVKREEELGPEKVIEV